MQEKNNAVCSICGNSYYLCMSCRDSIQLAPWKRFTDTAEHYKVFQIVRGYNTNVYTKDEARNKLKNVDLSDLHTFRPHIKSTIENILREPVIEKLTVSQRKNYKKIKVDEKVVNDTKDDVVEVVQPIEIEKSILDVCE